MTLNKTFYAAVTVLLIGLSGCAYNPNKVDRVQVHVESKNGDSLCHLKYDPAKFNSDNKERTGKQLRRHYSRQLDECTFIKFTANVDDGRVSNEKK